MECVLHLQDTGTMILSISATYPVDPFARAIVITLLLPAFSCTFKVEEPGVFPSAVGRNAMRCVEPLTVMSAYRCEESPF